MIEYKKDANWQFKMLQYLDSPETIQSKILNLSGFGMNWGVWHIDLGLKFLSFNQIESIDLSCNYIDTQIIDFSTFSRLKTINLFENPLFYWGNEGKFRMDEQIKAPGLETLNLSNCQTGIIIIGQKASFLHSLKWLDLSANHFTDYHPDYPNNPPFLNLATMPNLKYLALRDNFYSFVPKLRFLPSIETIDLSNNPIRSNFEELTFLPNLKNIKLNNLSLKKIPDCFFKLKNIELIELKNNNIPGSEIQKLRAHLTKAEIIC